MYFDGLNQYSYWKLIRGIHFQLCRNLTIFNLKIIKKWYSFWIYFCTHRYCGVIDAKRIGLVTSVERIVEFIFMQALAYPNSETDEDDVSCSLIKSQLLPGLRSFCSALRVCEQVCQHFNVFDDGKMMFVKIDNSNEVRELAKNKEFCTELEERVTNWIKGVAKVWDGRTVRQNMRP